MKINNISYTDIGSGNVILLLHGYLETKEVWNNFANELEKYNRVICIDIPGHGKSGIIDKGHSMDLIAEKINILLKELNINRCCLVGHSMGGYVALAYAKLFGSKLSGLVLFHSSVYADTEEKRQNRAREIEMIRKGKKEMIFKTSLPKMFANDNLALNKGVIEDIYKKALEHSDDGICSLLMGMMTREDMQEFVTITNIPMLFIFGKKDNYIPTLAAEKMLQLNNDIKFKWLDNSGHMGFVEDMAESKISLLDFVSFLEF